MTHTEIVNFIWGVADLIRDTFKRGKYQDVILPLTVLRRLDCVLAPTKRKVLDANAKLKGKLQNLDPQLRKASGFAFYNTSLYDFEKLLADAPNLAANLRNYINGFSPNMREVIEKFEFDNTISRLQEAGLLFKVLERFKNVDLHPDKVDNPTMGTVFEELIRKFNEALNENPGEEPVFQKLAESKKKDPKQRAAEEAEGQAEQERVRRLLADLPGTLHQRQELQRAAREAHRKLPAPILKAILSALSERDQSAEICRDEEGHSEPDPELRDSENVPLASGDDPADEDGVSASVRAFFDREVAPHVPDAWINTAARDHRDKLVGKVGYEINFNRYFYKYTPPRPLEEIVSDIQTIEKEILQMLREVAG